MCSTKKTCFLFGHRDTPDHIYNSLIRAIEKEILNGAVYFYVGYRGNFDLMTIRALREAKRKHPHIVPMLLLSHHPAVSPVSVPEGFDGSYYPPIGNVPSKYCIIKCNEYAVRVTDSIICYVGWVGTCRNLLGKAIHRNIPITNLYNSPSV